MTWTDRVWHARHARRLTFAAKDVLLTLARYRGRGGACTPRHETLAERVGCSVRTVQRALQAARDLGLVSWCERRVRVGWRMLRTSNSYTLTTPATIGLKVRASFKRKILPVPSFPCVPLLERGDALAALERVRQERERMLWKGWA